MKKRENTILELLSEHEKMEVSALAEALGVSQVTVRKDLDSMESKGILRREHGYAVFGGHDDINNRLAIHYDEKRRIAQRAAALVSPGETVMIESGSCCALLAEELVRTKPGVTIVTNSAFIASYVRKLKSAKVVLLGGDFQNDAEVMVGPILKTCAAQFYVEQLFVGTDGFSQRLGFTGNDHLRVQAVRDMAEHAGRVVVVTESSKFAHHGVVPLNLTKGVNAVVTDDRLPKETESLLRKMDIQVYTSKQEGEQWDDN